MRELRSNTSLKQTIAISLTAFLLAGSCLMLSPQIANASGYKNSGPAMDGYCKHLFGSEAYYRWDWRWISNCHDNTFWGPRNVAINITSACRWKYGSKAVGLWMNGYPACWVR